MPPFSGIRARSGPAKYSVVGAAQSHDVIDEYERRGTLAHDDLVNRRSVDVSDRPGDIPYDSTEFNSERGDDSNDQIPKTYAGPTIRGWPTSPGRLRGVSVPLLIGDVLLALLPIAFLVLAIVAWQLNGERLSNTGRVVERAMNLGPTIYPLAFAAIASRCLRSIAVCFAERGTTISTLEMLLGSQSLVSAIGTVGTLRSANVFSFGLLLLWALSPLGGQSSLRLLHRTNSTIVEQGMVYYADHAATFPYATDQIPWISIVPAILSSSLSSSEDTKRLQVDLWGHPKVPRLDQVEQQARSNPTSVGSWVDINPEMTQTYSSWTGVNVQNLRRTETAEFDIAYEYMYLDCQRLYSGTPKDARDFMMASTKALFPPLQLYDSDESALHTLYNISVAGSALIGRGVLTFFLQMGYEANVTNQTFTSKDWAYESTSGQPLRFQYGALWINENDVQEFRVYSCAPHVVTVGAHVSCEAGVCSVTRLRYMPGASEEELKKTCTDSGRLGCLMNATGAEIPFMLFLPMMMATYAPVSEDGGPFDQWIAGSNVTYDFKATTSKKNILDQMPDKLISDRLATVLNTYWQSIVWGPQVTRPGLFERPDYPYSGPADSLDADRWLNETEATFTRLVPVYRADIGWIITLLVVTTVLLLLSIVSLVASFVTTAPDLFYYASSLARENPYTDTPDGGTALDGAKRSRLLKKMKVQVADASPEHQVGYVVLKSVEEGEDFRTGRLRKDRLYW